MVADGWSSTLMSWTGAYRDLIRGWQQTTVHPPEVVQWLSRCPKCDGRALWTAICWSSRRLERRIECDGCGPVSWTECDNTTVV